MHHIETPTGIGLSIERDVPFDCAGLEQRPDQSGRASQVRALRWQLAQDAVGARGKAIGKLTDFVGTNSGARLGISH
jgi:hypothetical protein